jgi:hypothetical protein
VAGPVTSSLRIPAPLQLQQKQAVFKAVSVVQQILREFNGAVSDDAKILAIRKTVLKLRKQIIIGSHGSDVSR